LLIIHSLPEIVAWLLPTSALAPLIIIWRKNRS
jgi:hypothetical protein